MERNALLSNDRCYIVAEVAQAHDGSLGTAHAYIDAVANSGADAIKFQTHFADAESSEFEPFRVKFSRQDKTRYDYWKRLEFTPEQWNGLFDHCNDRQIDFLSSPFSLKAVDLLEEMGVKAWKIASGEVSNALMLDRIAATGKTTLVSSGMSDLSELSWTLDRLRNKVDEIAVLQCTTAYPCPPENIGLNMLDVFRTEFDVYAGLSDHSGTIFPGIAGAALGMSVLEIHVTFSRSSFGPDVPASVTLEELSQLVQGIRFVETMRANPLSKDTVGAQTEELRSMFMRGVITTQDLKAGDVIEVEQLDTRKPLRGVPASRYQEIIGKVVNKQISAGSFIQFSDLD